MLQRFLQSFLFADFPDFLAKEYLLHWFQEGRLYGDFNLQQFIFSFSLPGEVHFDLLLGFLQSLDEGVDSYWFQDDLLLKVLHSGRRIYHSEWKFALSKEGEFEIELCVSIADGGFGRLHIPINKEFIYWTRVRINYHAFAFYSTFFRRDAHTFPLL